ncbi:Transposase [Theobroma cacao]|nr:Transposase [Theobroma cacao]
MQGVRSDLSFVGLMKLIEDVVGVNSEIDEIELHALISTPGELSRPIIKDDEDVALILLEQRNVLAVYVSIKGRQTNVMSHGEVGQHGCASNQFLASLEQMQRSGETVECVMPLSNENTIIEDNNVRLEGDTATLEYNTAFDEGNEDLFATGEDRFNHTSDDGLEQSQDDSSDDDCLYDSDIPICNNVEGETEPVGGVDVGDVQCDDPIYNNPITGENGILSFDTLLDDNDQKRENARISRMWVIAGAERFSFQTITTKESTCAEDRLYKGRIFSSKVELKRALNMLVIKEKFAIRVKGSCKTRYEVGCKDKACKFSVRATKLPARGEYWKVQTFHKVHTCTVDGLQGRFLTTSVKMIGELMSYKIRANGVALRPKDIICEMRVQWGLKCLYEQENPSTVTAVATDEEERFKYCFWSYGACIRGFLDVMRLTVTIDVTHLKDRFKGVLFVAHLGIKKAIQNAYLEAHHGLCGYHLKKKFKNKFKRDDVCMLFTFARDCYKVADFNRHMNQIQQIHLGAHADLMRIRLEKWTRACSPTRRY